MFEALWYKLSCFGVFLDGPAGVFCGKNSVIKSMSIPTYFLNKRQITTLYYHRLSYSRSTDIIHVEWIPGNFNLKGFYKDNDAW